MTDEDQRRIRAIVDAALQRDPEERSQYLDEACRGEPDLRARAEELLRGLQTSAVGGETVSGMLQSHQSIQLNLQDVKRRLASEPVKT